MASGNSLFAYRRRYADENMDVLLDVSSEQLTAQLGSSTRAGCIVFSTRVERADFEVGPEVALGPNEGAIVLLAGHEP